MKFNKRGFTLIELLVVIAIIGLLSTLAVVSLNNARQKARDARRVSDIKQIQTALELFYNDKNLYPVQAAARTLGSAAYATLSSDIAANAGFAAATSGTVYMGKVPEAPTPPSANVYTYAISTGATYSIAFTLENAIPSLGSGTTCTAVPAGITCV
ncbi:type II secretion system protein [Patescibacteria group bacterium]